MKNLKTELFFKIWLPAVFCVFGFGNLIAQTTWNFNTDTEGWMLINSLSGQVNDGKLQLNTTGADPYMVSDNSLAIDASNVNTLTLNCTSNVNTGNFKLFWTTNDAPNFSADKSIVFSVANSSIFSDYVVDLSSKSTWTGTIKQLRLDVGDQMSSTVEIDYIQISYVDRSGLGPTIWTFDCDQEGWGIKNHANATNAIHELSSSTVNSGHIEMITPQTLTQGWMFGINEAINADVSKYIHFSLTIDNADQLPDTGLNALLVLADANDQNTSTEVFKMYKGQRNYTINLSNHAQWVGPKYINRIHFPQTTGPSYNIKDAIYRLDWISVSDNATPPNPIQDTSQECIAVSPILGGTESVIFCNRVSVKSSYTGSRVNTSFKYWKAGTNNIVEQTRTIFEAGNIYFSAFDLDLNTTYNYSIELTNTAGGDETEVGQFTTEGEFAEDQPIHLWMTPSPFDLTENANDHLLDDDSWLNAGKRAQVYKIHGATYRAGVNSDYYSYDFPKLIYTVNKHRMRLALEQVVSGNTTGEVYASEIIGYLDEIANYGGKVEFFTWDGMMFRNFHSSTSGSNFRTPEQGLEEVALATELVKTAYPYVEIIPLPNLPNWDIKDNSGNIIPYNSGDWASETGVESWDYLCDIYLDKMNTRGIDINYIQIDHPYYAYLNDRTTSVQRVQAIKDYCTRNNLELMIIVNTTNLIGDFDAEFKQGCLDYIDALREDNINPDYIDIESWYPYPQYLVPETKENSFTNIILDAGSKFFYTDNIQVTAEGDVIEIEGINSTLQFYAVNNAINSSADVTWSISDNSLASIDENGLLTTQQDGEVTIYANLKANPDLQFSYTLTITNTLGVSNSSFNAIKIYPNPVNTNLFVHICQNITKAKVELIDLTGRVVFSKTLQNTINNLDLSVLSQGIYLIEIIENDNVIKQNKILVTP